MTESEALASIATALDRLSRVALLHVVVGRDKSEQAWLLDFVDLKQGEIAELLQLSQSSVSRAISRYKEKRRDASD
jgi:DNA-directed RNA polymerase specialized sigma24 family protein